MTQFLFKLLYLTRGNHKSLIVMIFTFILISGLEVFGIGMIGPFITIATNLDWIKSNYLLDLIYKQLNFNSEQQFLAFIGLLVIFSFCMKAFLAFNAQKKVFKIAYELKADLAYKLMKAYIRAPYSFHLNVNSAVLIQNILDTTEYVCLGFVMPLLTSISNTLILLALIVLLIKTSTMAMVFIAILLPIVLVMLKMLKNRLARWREEGWKAYGQIIRIINHGLGGLKETRVIGCESYFENQIEEQLKKYAMNLTLYSGYSNFPRFSMEALMISFLVVFTFLFINLNLGTSQSINGVLGIFALSSVRLLPVVGNLVSGINMARSNTFAVEKIFLDFKELEEKEIILSFDSINCSDSFSSNQDNQAISFSEQIVLDRIAFEYPNTTKNTLDGISLTIHKGQSIGIIGKSGAGKTTLVDVLLGLFIPQSGDIKVDGISVYTNLRAWQNILGYVPQSIFLSDDTLERNIAFGVPDYSIDQDRLWRAIEMAQLGEVVEQLPDGVKTVVGERGVLLSGGQRQRVGIARVLYHEREILVFDEATAALDTETEDLVTEATKALSGTKTIIIIAHRLSTIEHCDCIYQIEQGRILKSGSYQEIVLCK